MQRYDFMCISLILMLSSAWSYNSRAADNPNSQTTLDLEEAPPPAEFPYPGASESGFDKKAPISRTGPIPIDQDPPAKKNMDLPRPSKVNADGEYFYDDKTPTDSVSTGVVPPPVSKTKEGEFEYGKPPTPRVPDNPIPDVERPASVTAAGYQYKMPKTISHRSASFSAGLMSTPNITNPLTGANYGTIYGNSPQPAMLFDYEWKLTRKIGHVGIRVGSGLSLAMGGGRFVNQQLQTEFTPTEQFTFFIFPNTATLIYRFQYSDTQIFVPYVEAGPGFYTFIETRDDNLPPKIGGAAVGVGGGGFMINLDQLDRGSMRDLQEDFGINHVMWFLGARGVAGLNPNYDFTGFIANTGFIVEF